MMIPLFGLIRKNNLPELYVIKNFHLNIEKFVSFDEIANFAKGELLMDKMVVESVYLLSMMEDNTPIGVCEISKGGADRAYIPMNALGTALLLTGANKFLLLHNHPTNDCTPSIEDKNATDNVMKMADLLNIQLEDHMIISRNNWTTMIHKRPCQNGSTKKK